MDVYINKHGMNVLFYPLDVLFLILSRVIFSQIKYNVNFEK